MRYLIFLLFLSGCTLNTPNIEYKGWVCLKTQTDLSPGLNFNGDFTLVATDSCMVSRCAIYSYQDSKHWYIPNGQYIHKILQDNECL